jgi:ELWxxDGT repeat protein
LNRYELWTTDGTSPGTTMIKDLPFTGTFPGQLTTIGDKLMFIASDPTHGNELWTSDGTIAGTQMVMDVNPGVNSSTILINAVYQDKIIFHNNTSTWISDGTEAGTQTLLPGVLAYGAREFKGALYLTGPIIGTNDFGSVIFKTDGTPANTFRLDTIGNVLFQYVLPIVNDKIIFPMNSSGTGTEPGISDGSLNNASLLKDINPGSNSSSPRFYAELNNKVIFMADDGVRGFELWITDGTTAGTTLLKEVKAGTESANIDRIFTVNGKLHFLSGSNPHQRDLWRSDGTTSGTTLTHDFIEPHILGHTSENLIIFDQFRFWKSDGTPAGTSMMLDLNSMHNSAGYSGSDGISVGHNLYFLFEVSGQGTDIWKANTLTNQVTRVPNNDDPEARFLYGGISGAALGNELVFVSHDDAHGMELWITKNDGSQKELLKDIDPGTSDSSPDSFISAGDKVFFAASTSATGRELWVTDGTAAGTVLVKDIYPGPEYGFLPQTPAMLQDKLIFAGRSNNNGSNLWLSDGSSQGTAQVKQIDNGSFSPTVFTRVNDKVYFSAGHSFLGEDLYVTDGTAQGTILIDAVPRTLVALEIVEASKGAAYFTSSGKIWRTRGTASTTEIVANDIEIFSPLHATGNYVCFIADHPLFGRELFGVEVTKFNQTISFSLVGMKLQGDAPFPVTANATSGLPVTFTSADDKVTIANNQVQLQKAGEATVTATQEGDAVFNAATPVSETFCIKPPKPEITIDLTNPASPTLISSSAEGNNWYKDLVLLGNEQVLQASEAGEYTLQVNIDGCISEVEAAVLVITGIEDLQNGIHVYPNPASEFIHVQVPVNQGETQFQFLDAQGRIIHNRLSAKETETFDLTGIPKGIYVMRMIRNNKSDYRLIVTQ